MAQVITPDTYCLAMAKKSIIHGIQHGSPWIPDPAIHAFMTTPYMVFTQITYKHQVLGCYSHPESELWLGICKSAYASMFQDRRDGDISQYRLQQSEISVHVLQQTKSVMCTMCDILPEIHAHTSVRVQWGGAQAVLLSKVQRTSLNTHDFLIQLLKKAHIHQDHGHLNWTLYHTIDIGPTPWNQIPQL